MALDFEGCEREHVFKCPKCGGTEVEVELRTKLHLLCFRCDHKWSELTLDKRVQWVAREETNTKVT